MIHVYCTDIRFIACYMVPVLPTFIIPWCSREPRREAIDYPTLEKRIFVLLLLLQCYNFSSASWIFYFVKLLKLFFSSNQDFFLYIFFIYSRCDQGLVPKICLEFNIYFRSDFQTCFLTVYIFYIYIYIYILFFQRIWP